MKRYFITTYTDQWKTPTAVLEKELDFQTVNLDCSEYPSVPNWKKLILCELTYIKAIIMKFNCINNSNIIISPNYLVLFLLLCKKLHILKVGKLCWFGMFIHNPRILRKVGRIVRFLYPSDDSFKIIVFSSGEAKLYAKEWRLPEGSFLYNPYGDWNKETASYGSDVDDGYFFSGGYSNRDYVSLIKIFENLDEKLIIVASSRNNDLVEYEANTKNVPDNINIYYDLPQEQFTELLIGSTAVIFHMKYNTGASGQMVALNAMRNNKLIISSYMDALNDYIQDGINAIVYDKDKTYELLPMIVHDVGTNLKKYSYLTAKAFSDYSEFFSSDGLSKKLISTVKELL